MESGGKKVISIKRAGLTFGGALLTLSIVMAWFGPGPDTTFYFQTTVTDRAGNKDETPVAHSAVGAMEDLFSNGRRQLQRDQIAEADRKKKRVTVRYFAQQLVGAKNGGPKAIKMGSKLIGFLLSPVDTRSPALVRVCLPRGGESGGIEIEPGSTLLGQYSYPGEGSRVFFTFSQLETPDGEAKRVHAQALDSGTYTAGVNGKLVSDGSVKVAARVGLTMFASMTDVMTEKESLGPAANGVQVKSTMKNGLLQGVSRAAQDQTNRTASEIDSIRDFVVLEKGTEMIVELTEDFSK